MTYQDSSNKFSFQFFCHDIDTLAVGHAHATEKSPQQVVLSYSMRYFVFQVLKT